MTKPKDFLNVFRDINVKFSRVYASVLCRTDLTLPQFALLSYLAFHGSKSMTQASRELHVTKPAVTYLTDLLEKKKLIKRAPSTEDRRIYNLQITPKGKAAVNKIQKLVLSFLFDSLKRFDGKEKKVVFDFYEVLAGTLNSFLKKEKA